MYSLARLSEQPNKRTPEKCLFSGVLAHLRGFEPLAYRLGVHLDAVISRLKKCKMCQNCLFFSQSAVRFCASEIS